MTQTTNEIVSHYVCQMQGIVSGLLDTVLKANGLPKVPQAGSELKPVPVFESEATESLLSLANIRASTSIMWPTTPQLNYLQAYYKRYRGPDGRMRNDIVVLASNYCWARFYATKELIHCFTDDDGFPASNSIDSVNDLIESLASGGFALREDCQPQTIIDEIAWLGATLYLVPNEWLPTIRQLQIQIEEAFQDGNSHFYLAQMLRVPELVLRHRLKQRK